MQTVRIYRLKDLDRRTRARLKAAQLDSARVWMYCEPFRQHCQMRSYNVTFNAQVRQDEARAFRERCR